MRSAMICPDWKPSLIQRKTHWIYTSRGISSEERIENRKRRRREDSTWTASILSIWIHSKYKEVLRFLIPYHKQLSTLWKMERRHKGKMRKTRSNPLFPIYIPDHQKMNQFGNCRGSSIWFFFVVRWLECLQRRKWPCVAGWRWGSLVNGNETWDCIVAHFSDLDKFSSCFLRNWIWAHGWLLKVVL